MEESGIARFPRPVYGRIPNFEGSEIAAKRLIRQPEFINAEVVKVNPDSPQSYIRRGVLLNGKKLIMPSPRLRSGFILLDPDKIPKRSLTNASSIKGAFEYGNLCPLEGLPEVDLIVTGCVAVSKEGVRIGKGGGYGEIEYGILKDIDSISEETPVFTSIHDVQLIEKIPREEHDLLVDFVSTPTKTIRMERRHLQPEGIIWERITEKEMEHMPILQDLKKIVG